MLPVFLSIGLIIIAAMVLAGWYLSVPALRSVVAGLPPMVPNTAIGFLIAAISLLLLLNGTTPAWKRYIGQGLAVVCMMAGLLTLLGYSGAWPGYIVLDNLFAGLFPEKPLVLRPSPHTAFSFVLAGVSLVLIGFENTAILRAGRYLAFIILIVPIIVLFGYLYGQTGLYVYRDVIGMSAHSALGFILLSLAIVTARPDTGFMKVITGKTIGGQVLRRILPAVVFVPWVLGWVILYGYRANLYSPGFGIALLQVLTLLVLVVVILHVVSVINREENMRKLFEADLRKSEESLREFAMHLEKVREDERSAVARDIHDEVGGMLAALKMDLGLISSRCKQSNMDQAIFHRLRKATEHVDLLMQTVRRIISKLRPSILDNLGLLDAIEWQLSEIWQRYGIQYNYDRYLEDGQVKFENDDYATNVFRVFQEVSNNIVRHARASMVTVLVTIIDNSFVISISDNGRGMPDNQAGRADSFGLISIRERVHSMKGECSVVSRRGFGTTVTISIPLSVADE